MNPQGGHTKKKSTGVAASGLREGQLHARALVLSVSFPLLWEIFLD
jgi:hypothetical protein